MEVEKEPVTCTTLEWLHFQNLEGTPTPPIQSSAQGPNFTWPMELLSQSIDSAENNDAHYPETKVTLPDVADIKYWVVVAVALILLRKFVEKHISYPIGLRLGMKPRSVVTVRKIPCRKPEMVPILESFYLSKPGPKNSSHAQILNLIKETHLHEREIQRWLRRRRALDRPSKLTKFTESSWRFVCYICSTAIGVWTVWDKEWTWDIEKRWSNFPNHDVPQEMRLYYMYGSGLYLSLFLTQAFDVKRKDFWEMFVHHVVTIILLTASWTLNLCRTGILILLLHDCADVLLELAKMANYARSESLATWTFGAFTIVWTITRLYVFPKKLIWDDCRSMVGHVPPGLSYPLVGLLLTLFCLHLFWTYCIVKVAMGAFSSGQEKAKDVRSSSESSLESQSEIEEEAETAPNKNTRPRALRRGSESRSSSFSNPILARIDTNQRKLIRRISAEIM